MAAAMWRAKYQRSMAARHRSGEAKKKSVGNGEKQMESVSGKSNLVSEKISKKTSKARM